MGTVYTETKCQREGCKSIDRIEGSFPERMPDGWGEVLGRTLCPKCFALVKKLVCPKPRSDKGATHARKGQRSPKSDDPDGSGSKDEEPATKPEQAFKTREIEHIPCPDCPDKKRKACVLTGIKAIDCYGKGG